MTQGIPDIPDLTQLSQILAFGSQLIGLYLTLAGLTAGFGVVLALLNLSMWSDAESKPLLRQWLDSYCRLLPFLLHILLVLALLLGGFLLCATLANRFHWWEQAKITRNVAEVTGDRLEQFAPIVRYQIPEPFTVERVVDGVPIKEERTRLVTRYLEFSASQVRVNLDRFIDPQTRRSNYKAEYSAEYLFTNTLKSTEQFVFESAPPSGYTVLSNFVVEHNGKRIRQTVPNSYNFPFRVKVGDTAKLRVSYQTQGAPRWVYNPNNRLLSSFRLEVITSFGEVDFAGGILPTERKNVGNGVQFTWIFDDNVSVLNPFGVFSGAQKLGTTGLLPRLLILAPAIFLWWILLLYLSLPLTLRQVAIAGGIFFAGLLSLTYLSRLLEPMLAWTVIAIILLGLAWRLGNNHRLSLGILGCTLAGAIIPVYALLFSFSGLLLGTAGLLSVIWLSLPRLTQRM